MEFGQTKTKKEKVTNFVRNENWGFEKKVSDLIFEIKKNNNNV